MRVALATRQTRLQWVSPATTNSGSGTAMTVALPAGGRPGDRLFVFENHNNETESSADNNTGFVTTEQGEYPGSLGSGEFVIYYRDLTGSEPATLSYTLSISERWVLSAAILRGVHPTSIFDVVPAFHGNESSTSPTCGGITTLTPGCFLIAMAGTDGTGNGTFSAGPVGWTELVTNNTQQPMSIFYREQVEGPGATGDVDFTTSPSGNNYAMKIFSIPPGPARPRDFLRLAAVA